MNTHMKKLHYTICTILTLIILGLVIDSEMQVAYGDALDDLQHAQSASDQDHPSYRRVGRGRIKRRRQDDNISEETFSGLEGDPGLPVLPANKDVQYEYRIGAHDVLEVEVFQIEDLRHTARVNSSGYISVPLLGSIKVEGLTVEEAEGFITAAYARDYLQDPHVSIYVKEYESQKYTVEGEVKETGVFPLKGPTTLLQAIATAKGVGTMANLEEVVIFRTDSKGQVIGYLIDIDKVREGEIEDPFVATQDIIVVPRAGNRDLIERITSTLRGFIGFGRIPL
jgi:polysaccharide export outer membrane protein